MAMAYRSSQSKDVSSSDSEDDNSENEQSWKHRPSKARSEPEETPESKKRKATSVWVNVLMEQSLTDNLTQCDVERGPMVARDCESYQLPPQEERDPQLNHFTQLLKGLPDLAPNEARRADKLAALITRQLHERKHMLIKRCVYILGIETCRELLQETQLIEDKGGMLIKNGGRRRTPGGVFFFLLKSSPAISSEKKKHVFELEDAIFEKKNMKKWSNSRKNKKGFNKPGRAGQRANNTGSDSPDLGTPDGMEMEVPLEEGEIGEEVELEEGEIED